MITEVSQEDLDDLVTTAAGGSADLPERVGRLTRTGFVGGELIVARCACGFPSVIVPKSDWTREAVVGCAVCHVGEVNRQAEAREAEERRQAAEAREKRQAERMRDLYVDPHYEELSPRLKKLFRLLSGLPSFDLDYVTRVTKAFSREDAWRESLFPMIGANVLIERQGVFGETKRYSMSRPYDVDARPTSTYTVRQVAVRQMEAEDRREAAELAAKLAAKAEDLTRREDEQAAVNAEREKIRDFCESEVRSFVEARCLVGEGLSESPVVLRARYAAMTQERGEEPISPLDFSDNLARLGYELRGGKVRGLRLKTMAERAERAEPGPDAAEPGENAVGQPA